MRLAAVIAATALSLTMPAAQAASDIHADDTKDVWTDTWTSDTGEWTERVPSTESRNVDATSTRVTHGRRTVRAVVSYVNLEKAGEDFGVSISIRGSDSVISSVDLMARPTEWSGTSVFWRGGTEVSCEGMTHSIDYPANTVTVTVPRRCLARPLWIQYSGVASASTYGNGSWTRHTDQLRSDQATHITNWSPRIRRS